MTRTQRLGLGIVFAAAICLPVGATASSTAAEVVRVPVVRAFVEYGDPPLSVPTKYRARLTFQGRRGDVVHLSGAVGVATLRSRGRTVHETWSTYGYGRYYRLKADRRYTFSVRPYVSYPVYNQRLRLEKLALRPVTRDGPPVRFGANRRGFVPAVSFDLKPGERTMITTPAYAAMVFTEHQTQLLYGDPILEVGQRLATARGDVSYAAPPLERGQVIVLVGREGTTRGVGSEVVPVTLDGALTAVKASDSQREVALRFPAEAGQIVRVSGVLTGTTVSPTMFGPTEPVPHAGSGLVWRVTESGMQTIGLFPPASTPVGTGVALVTRIGSMTADGPALTFSSPEAGRWVYADVDGGYSPVLTSTGSTFAPGSSWSASVTEPTSARCLEPHPANGCGDRAAVTVTEATPQAWSYFYLPPTGSFVFLEVPPGTTGSVDLRVTKRVPVTARRGPARPAPLTGPTR